MDHDRREPKPAPAGDSRQTLFPARSSASCVAVRAIPWCSEPFRGVLFRLVPLRSGFSVPSCSVLCRSVPPRSALFHVVPCRVVLFRVVPFRPVPSWSVPSCSALFRFIACRSVPGCSVPSGPLPSRPVGSVPCSCSRPSAPSSAAVWTDNDRPPPGNSQ